MADREGRLYDGDQLLYVIASDYKRRSVANGGVVGTLMSNLGFEHALARKGIPLARAKVGDRYVLEQMQAQRWLLGVETPGTSSASTSTRPVTPSLRPSRSCAR